MERILKSARESGSLNLSNRALSEVPGEVYNNLDTGSLDDKWWEGVDLQKLILAHNNLEVLREDLRNLSSLVVLNISHNQISSLPAAIGDLPLLKSLDASFNQIKLVPEELGLATALVNEVPGEVYNNLDTGSLDDKWWEGVDLQKLILAHNNLEVLREDLRNLSSLVVLNISHNQISSLPAAIGDLPLLKSLDASFNQIKLVPEELGLATALVNEVPGEVYNNLDTGSLDDKWWEGVDLQKLILAHNNLEVLREDLRNLSSLVVLNISHNQISSLPAAIGDLPLLKSLDASFNQIKLVPEELGLATALVNEVPGEVYNNLDTGSLDDKWWEGVDLQKLILAHNNLEVLREDLRNLSSLVVLNISHNQISSLPAAIGDLPLLKSLDASFNQIKLVPEELGLATALVKVDLSNNCLNELPASLGRCLNLSELKISKYFGQG